MVIVRRTEEFLNHAGVKGMKWGYNDGSRNGRRTAAELKKVAEAVAAYQKNNTDKNTHGSGDVEGDYHEANNMLRYLGITLDLQSDDNKVAETMGIYNQMKNTKDSYKTQHEWLKAFSTKLAAAGYDMDAVNKMLDANKDKLNVMATGTGSGNREKSNQDWKENDAKATSKKTSSKKTSSKSKSSSKAETKSTTTKSKTTSTESNKADDTTETKKEKTKMKVNKTNNLKSTINYTNKYRARRISDPIQKAKTLTKLNHSEIQNGDELYHHGILGQRWGVRRYQNPDGSLTDEGRKRYGDYSHMSDDELRNKINRKKMENRYKDLKVGRTNSISNTVGQATDKASKVTKVKYGKNSDVTKTTNAVGDVAKDTAKIADKIANAKNTSAKDKIDLSNMSNADLQKAINRMQMEQEMKQLDKSEINRGKVITTDTLQSIGLVASTAVDVLTLAILMKKVLKK